MRRFGIVLMIAVALVATSCSKDQVHDDVAQLDPAKMVTPYGTFEGYWKLSKYGLRQEGTIRVENGVIMFELPADYLVPRLKLVSEKALVEHANEPFFTTTTGYTYQNTEQTLGYTEQGYSSDAIYMEIKNSDADSQTALLGNSAMKFNVVADGVNYEVRTVGTKDHLSAVLDKNTCLWTLAIPIDKVVIYNPLTGMEHSVNYHDEEHPERSAWKLVFTATKLSE
jgi:hypothetical protein